MEGSDEAGDGPRARIIGARGPSRKVYFDIAITLTAIFISGLSMFVAIEHSKTERDLVRAASTASMPTTI